MAILAMDVPHEVMRPSLGWFGSFLSAGARICLFRPLFSGLFRLVSPGVETAQSHIHIHSYPIDPIGLFEDAVASTNGLAKRPICPTDAQLLSLATYFFPARLSLKVTVCDFGEGRFERFDVDLGGVWQCKSLFVPSVMI